MHVHWLFAVSIAVSMEKTEEIPSTDLKMQLEPVKLQNPS